MKAASFLGESLKIAANRTATQASSILIIALLGVHSTRLLAAFSIALAAVAIYFVAITTLQFGIQLELSRQFAKGKAQAMYGVFFSALWFALAASTLVLAAAWLLPAPFNAIQNAEIKTAASAAYHTLLLSLPLFAGYTAIHFLFESIQRSALAFRLKSITVALQLAITCWILYGRTAPATAADIAFGYLISDAIGLVISIFYCARTVDRAHFWRAARASLQPWRQYPHYARAIRMGLPTATGAIAQKYLFYFMGMHCMGMSTASASAFSIFTTLIFFLQIPVLGISHLATLKIAHAAGTRNAPLLASTLCIVRKNFIAIFAFIVLASWAALPALVRPFTADAEVSSLILGLAYLFPLYYLLHCLLNLCTSMLRGLSDDIYPQAIVNGVLFSTLIPLLALRPQTSFSELIAAYCVFGFLATGIMVFRWRNKHGEAML